MGHNENLKELWSIHRVIYVWSSKIFVVFLKKTLVPLVLQLRLNQIGVALGVWTWFTHYE
jgi:hypothetical protein